MDDDVADLEEHWTLLDEERALLVGKWGHTRLGFALLLKAFQLDGAFATGPDRFPDAVVGFVARQVDVETVELVRYRWSGRTNVAHRAEVRSFTKGSGSARWPMRKR